MIPRQELTPELALIVQKIRALRDYTARTGFHTTRAERDLLAKLNGDDLAQVILALSK